MSAKKPAPVETPRDLRDCADFLRTIAAEEGGICGAFYLQAATLAHRAWIAQLNGAERTVDRYLARCRWTIGQAAQHSRYRGEVVR